MHLKGLAALGDVIRRKIPEQQTRNRGNRRNLQRPQKHLEEQPVTEEARKILQSEFGGNDIVSLRRECIQNDQKHRRHNQNERPDDIGICHSSKLFHSIPFRLSQSATSP